MKIIAITSQKGGVGKSTISIHLAAEFAGHGKRVVLADLDPHSRTATEWASMRAAREPMVVLVEPDQLHSMIDAVRAQGVDIVILDMPPYVDAVTANAASMADMVLIPARPSFPDLRSLPRVLAKIGRSATVVLNGCHPGLAGFEASKTREARAVLEAAGIAVGPVSIPSRVAYTDALNDGRAVTEYESSGKAAREIQKLAQWVGEQMEV